ncbi:LuxR family transcriptional regulator [Lentzea sp. NPDC005914]|uniref:ATP-binding protein n=1 Tax=Lentzea sp. NPDC005914 TaxID=3154572 RepID=UPI0033F07617
MAELPGRARELAVLRRLLAADGARCVVVTGEPGIGKSRLLAELTTLATGWTVRGARAAEFESHVPFGVFVTALDDHLARLEPDRLAVLGPERLGLLATIFPAIPADGPADLVDAERYRLHRAVRALLELLVEPCGLVLVLDDLHWADEGSVELLDFLLRHPPRGRLLLALASRSRQTSSRLWHALSRAAADGVAELLELAPLALADADLLLPAELGRSRREEIHRAGAGNPFYLEALVRADANGLPVAVHAVLAAELAALTPRERVVAHAAAVVGDDFDAGSLAETATLAPESVLTDLDRLADRDLVRLDVATGRFRYRHPLVRSVAYQDAGPGWRLQAHGRAAAALRRRGAPPAEFARHVERSAARGDLDAVAVLGEAAEATMHSTPATAAHFLRAAIRLLPDAESATPQRLLLLGRLAQALGATGDLRQASETMHEVLRLLPVELTAARARTVRACATVERLLGRYTEATAMLRGEWRRIADTDAHSAAVLQVALLAGRSVERERAPGRDEITEVITAARDAGDPTLLAMALSVATLVDLRADRLDEAAALVDGLPDGDLVRDIDAVFWLGWAEASADRLTAAGRHVGRGLRLARASGQTHAIAVLTAIRGMVHAYVGELAEAANCFEDGMETAELTDSDELRVTVLTFGCWITALRGDPAEAVRLGERAVAIDDHSVASNTWRSGQAEAMLAQALVHNGDPHGCVEVLLSTGGGPELPAVDPLTRPLTYQLLAEAEVAIGRDATGWADRAEDAATALGVPLRTAMAELARAIATLPTDPAAAAPFAVAAAGTFTRLGVAVEAGRAHLLAATAFGGSDEIELAREHFVAARTVFTRCDARLFLPQLAREERRMNARRPRRAETNRFDLTAREVEIAALVADGLTNRDIGLRLHLSPRTVEVHLGRIYAKAGVSGRAALAGVWASAQSPRSRT